MANYKIFYNPCNNDVEIEKNGNPLTISHKLRAGIRGKQLTSWFDAYPGWEGLAEEICKNNKISKIKTKNCTIRFIGRTIDFKDLEESFNKFQRDHKDITFEFIPESLYDDTFILHQLTSFIDKIIAEFSLTDLESAEINEKIKSLKMELSDPEQLDNYEGPRKISDTFKDIMESICEEEIRNRIHTNRTNDIALLKSIDEKIKDLELKHTEGVMPEIESYTREKIEIMAKIDYHSEKESRLCDVISDINRIISPIS